MFATQSTRITSQSSTRDTIQSNHKTLRKFHKNHNTILKSNRKNHRRACPCREHPPGCGRPRRQSTLQVVAVCAGTGRGADGHRERPPSLVATTVPTSHTRALSRPRLSTVVPFGEAHGRSECPPGQEAPVVRASHADACRLPQREREREREREDI
jgi:hypothetical protein